MASAISGHPGKSTTVVPGPALIAFKPLLELQFVGPVSYSATLQH